MPVAAAAWHGLRPHQLLSSHMLSSHMLSSRMQHVGIHLLSRPQCQVEMSMHVRQRVQRVLSALVIAVGADDGPRALSVGHVAPTHEARFGSVAEPSSRTVSIGNWPALKVRAGAGAA